MTGLSDIFHTPPLVLTFLRNVKKQQQFLQKLLGQTLSEAEKNTDGTLDSSDFRKIYKYYGLAVPAILGEALCTLRGYPMTERERLAATYQGAMTGLCDDFFDKHDMPDQQLLSFINDPDAWQGNNSSEKLFLLLFRKALEYSHEPGLTLHYSRKVYEAQVESKKQAEPGLEQEEISRITIDKGGTSVLYFRSVFANQLDEQEEKALYLVGGLMQFGNDIFDVYKDSLEGIFTLMTTATHIDDVRQRFIKLQRESFTAFYHTGFSKKDIRRFLRMVSLSLCARCYVCLDQLEQLEQASNGIFDPRSYTRGQLVCDMDTARNKWRSVRYHLKQDLGPGI